MKENIFAFDERNYQNCQKAYRGARSEEYYLGDYSIEAGSVIDVRADRKKVGACSIIRLYSKTRLFFRRSWTHIREDATDVTVLWFVKRGRLCVTHQAGSSIAQAGDFIVTRSSAPFVIECQTDEEGVHEVLHLIVPTHALNCFMSHEVRTGFCVSARSREFTIAQRLLTDLFEDNGELSERIAQLLLDSAISVLSEAIKDRDAGAPVRQTCSDKRLKDAFRYIDIHVSDPNLSISTVANACGISVRYLSYLLKLYGVSFSRLVWKKRLEAASRWLVRSKPGEVSIAEIAYRVGFKSPPHFSRMFKRVYKMSPCEYREAGLSASAQAPTERSIGVAVGLEGSVGSLQ